MMIKEIARTELEEITRKVGTGLVPDLSRIEVETFVSALRTSFGLRAVRLALDARRRGDFRPVIDSFASTDGLDFSEFPRTCLIDQLEAATGLGSEVCEAVVREIETMINQRLESRRVVRLDEIGTMRMDHGRLYLDLHPDLRIGPESATVTA